MRAGLALLFCVGLIAGDSEPVVEAVAKPVAIVFNSKGGRLTRSPDQPGTVQAMRLQYEAVRLDSEHVDYTISALSGARQPVLATVDLRGGPDGRVLFDSTASQLPQVSFRGALRPRTLSIRRLDPDPAHPDEVRFRAEAADLGDIAGSIDTAAGPRRHVAWAERAVLEFAGAISGGSLLGIDRPRLVAMHFYGRSQPARMATVLRLLPGAPTDAAVVEPLLAARTYGMRAAGSVISLYFDALGNLQTIEGVEEGETPDGDNLIPMHAPNRPILGK